MIKILSCLLGAALFATTGCRNISPQTQRLIETDAVAGGVVVGLMKYPQARPAIAAAAPVVCAAANGTNVASSNIVAVLQAANIAGLNAAEAQFIINGSLAVYSAIENQFGTNNAAMKNYAGGLCDGLNLGLSLSPGTFKPRHRAFFARRPASFHIPAHL